MGWGGISRRGEERLAFREVLCSMELVKINVLKISEHKPWLPTDMVYKYNYRHPLYHSENV
jgi:hypothetical protein